MSFSMFSKLADWSAVVKDHFGQIAVKRKSRTIIAYANVIPTLRACGLMHHNGPVGM